MSKTILNIVPSFLLKGIKPNEIWNKYLEGKYLTSTINPEKVVSQAPVINSVAKVYSDNVDDPIYAFRDKYGNTLVNASSGQVLFQNFKDGQYHSKGRCSWCGHDWEDNYNFILIPLTLSTSKYNGNKIFIVYGERMTCDMECALSFINRELKMSYRSRDPNYSNSLQILLFTHRTLYPDRILHKAQDPALLDINGGCLTYDKYKNISSTYYRTTNIIQLPLKIQYLKI